MIRKMSGERPRSLCHAEERGNFRVQFNLITSERGWIQGSRSGINRGRGELKRAKIVDRYLMPPAIDTLRVKPRGFPVPSLVLYNPMARLVRVLTLCLLPPSLPARKKTLSTQFSAQRLFCKREKIISFLSERISREISVWKNEIEMRNWKKKRTENEGKGKTGLGRKSIREASVDQRRWTRDKQSTVKKKKKKKKGKKREKEDKRKGELKKRKCKRRRGSCRLRVHAKEQKGLSGWRVDQILEIKQSKRVSRYVCTPPRCCAGCAWRGWTG